MSGDLPYCESNDNRIARFYRTRRTLAFKMSPSKPYRIGIAPLNGSVSVTKS
jgi:hypothetical protein